MAKSPIQSHVLGSVSYLFGALASSAILQINSVTAPVTLTSSLSPAVTISV